MTSPSVLLQETEEGVRTLTLNRPEKRNALSSEMIEALREALAGAADDEATRVLMIRGAGKDFCAGADLAELEEMAALGEEENRADAARLGDLFRAMRSHPKPIVAAVQGRALAGGCGLATACDLILAHEDAQFGYPEVHLGFVPAMVMTILRRKVPEGIAFELVARGDRISAARAAQIGLVNQVVADSGFDGEVQGYARELAQRPASALKLSKQLLYELADLDFGDGMERGIDVNVVARFTQACRDGVRRFLARSRQ